MSVIRATVQGGKIVADVPADWPDGTVLEVGPADPPFGMSEADWPTTPEGIEDWLRWYDSLEPLILTPEDEQRIAAERRVQKEWFLAHAEERDRKLGEMFE